jgi:hypothetical protein
VTQKTLTYDELRIDLVDVYDQMGYHGEEPDDETRRETQAVISDVKC